MESGQINMDNVFIAIYSNGSYKHGFDISEHTLKQLEQKGVKQIVTKYIGEDKDILMKTTTEEYMKFGKRRKDANGRHIRILKAKDLEYIGECLK